jgi:hypothetical protein
MRSAHVCSLLVAVSLGLISSAAGRAADPPSADDVAALVAQLGDADYAMRETAATRRASLGAAAADALLAAAETSDDIEVALRTRWLVRELPAAMDLDQARKFTASFGKPIHGGHHGFPAFEHPDLIADDAQHHAVLFPLFQDLGFQGLFAGVVTGPKCLKGLRSLAIYQRRQGFFGSAEQIAGNKGE